MKKIFFLTFFLLLTAGNNQPLLSQEPLPDTVWRIDTYPDEINVVKFSPDDQYVYAAMSNYVLRIETQTGRIVDTLFRHSGMIYHLSLSPTGDTIATSGNSNTVRLWNTKSGELLKTYELPKIIDSTYGDISHIRANIFPDGKKILTESYNDRGNYSNFYVLNIMTKDIIKQFGYYDINYLSTISPDGKYLCFSDYDANNKHILLYDLYTYQQISKLTSSESDFKDIQFSPDSKYIAAGGEDSTLRIFDVEQRKLIKEIKYPNSWGIKKIGFTNDNNYLIVNVGYFRHYYLYIYETKNFQLIYNYSDYYGFNFDVSKNSNYIVSSGYLTGSWNIYLLNKKWTDVKVNEPLKENEIIYPNPVTQIININFENPEFSSVKIELINLTGEILKEIFSGILESGTQVIPFECISLPNGTYYIKITSPEFIKTFKLVKEG
jgi:WD40 repeat protein